MKALPILLVLLMLWSAIWRPGPGDYVARELELEPCLLLGMRLGEGSGCPLLFRILQGACAVLNGMATFPEAAIEDEYLTPIRQGDAFTVDKS